MARLPRLPDLLTSANLACGMGSVLLAAQGRLTWACWLVFAGAAFDVLDGLAARALGGGSELGKELDSLADMVTFGVAPGMILWSAPMAPAGLEGLPFSAMWIRGAAAAWIAVASAWRLAKFNIDTRQQSGFLGLPTPANALFWASLALSGWWKAQVAGMEWLLLALSAVLGGLMLSEIPLPSLKLGHLRWKGNEVIYLLLAAGALLIARFGAGAAPMIVALYLLSPLWGLPFRRSG